MKEEGVVVAGVDNFIVVFVVVVVVGVGGRIRRACHLWDRRAVSGLYHA